MIIGVDVDLVAVNSDLGLLEWCNNLSAFPLTHDEVFNKDTYGTLPYEFYTLYPDISMEQVIDYWRQADLYDNMLTNPGCGSVLQRWHNEGHHIVFVSALTGNHFDSKRKFLERYFPFAAGFIGTHQKQFANVDLLIDDRMENLNAVRKTGIIPVLFQTPYCQRVDAHEPVRTISSWYDLIISEVGAYTTILNCPLTSPIARAKDERRKVH